MYCPRCGTKNQDDHQFCSSCGFQITQAGKGASSTGLTGLSITDITENKLLQHSLTGKYEILSELGRGGFGVVFLAMDVRLNRKVAIKVLLLAHCSDETLVKRFINEAKLSASLDHPNIVRIYTIDSASAIHYFIMEYIPGPTLKKTIVEQSGISPFHTVKYCREIVKALAYAHSRGIIHRDIKPHNIILKNNENPVITDFGIAKALDFEGTQLTSAGIGSPQYISPEQLRNENIDARTDQYSVGCMMYEMLTGSPPFTGSGISIYQKQLYEQPVPIQSVNPRIPDELATIIHRLLQKNKTDRYDATQDLLAALDGIELIKQSRLVQTSEMTLTSGQQSISEILRNAKEAMESREFDRAISLCEMGRQMDQDNLELIYLLQQARINKESADNAKEHINQGIEKFHDRQYSEAIESFYRALALDKSNTEVQKLIERAQKFQSNHRKAEAIFREGKSLLEAKQYPEALSKLKEAKEFDTGFPELTNLIQKAEIEMSAGNEIQELLDSALQNLEQNRHDDAIGIFTQILQRVPDHATALEGLEKARNAKAKSDEIGRLESKIDDLKEAGHFETAISVLERLQSMCPEKSGDYELQIAHMEEEQDRERKIIARADQARAAAIAEQWPESLELWQSVLKSGSLNKNLMAEADGAVKTLEQKAIDSIIEQGGRLAETGQFKEAIDLLEKQDGRVNSNPAIQKNLNQYKKQLFRQNYFQSEIRKLASEGQHQQAGGLLQEWLTECPRDIHLPEIKKLIKTPELKTGKPATGIEKEAAKTAAGPPTDLADFKKRIRSKPDRDVTIIVPSTPIGTPEPAPAQTTPLPPLSSRKEPLPAPKPVKETPPAPNPSKKTPLLAAVGIPVLLIVAVAIWFVVRNKDQPWDAAQSTQTPVHVAQAATEKPVYIPEDIFPTPSPPRNTTHQIPATSVPVIQVPTRQGNRTPASGRNPVVERYIQSARSEFDNKAYRSANQEIAKAMLIDPNDPAVQDMKRQVDDKLRAADQTLAAARSLYQSGNYDAALASLQDLRSWDPYNQGAITLQSQVNIARENAWMREPTREPVPQVVTTPMVRQSIPPTARPNTPRPAARSTPVPTPKPVIPTAKPPPPIIPETKPPRSSEPPKIAGFNSPKTVSPNKSASFDVRVQDDQGIKNVILYYRSGPGSPWKQTSRSNIAPGSSTQSFSVPGSDITDDGLEVYLEVTDTEGNVTRKNNASSPQKIKAKSEKRAPVGGM